VLDRLFGEFCIGKLDANSKRKNDSKNNIISGEFTTALSIKHVELPAMSSELEKVEKNTKVENNTKV
jgi:hypothetical protein